MARHATQNTQAGRKTAAPAKHDGLMNKTSRLDVNTTTIAQHPVKEPKSVQKPEKHRKPRETVSAAGVFKKSKSKHEKKNSRRHREKTPEHELFLNITDGIEEARSSLLTTTKESFEEIHAAFTTTLTHSRAADIAFFESVNNQVTALSEPLVNERLITTTVLDGERVKETCLIGDRIEKFTKLLEKEEARLKDYWKQWEEVQNEYLDLGVEVFGAEVFGEDGKGRETQRGWRRAMELAEMEHETRVHEIEVEVGEIRGEFLQVMKQSEKVLDTNSRKEQARLLQALIQE